MNNKNLRPKDLVRSHSGEIEKRARNVKTNIIGEWLQMLIYFLVPILLIALIFENQINSILKEHQKIKWAIIAGISLLFSSYLWGHNLWAKWWIIDDHQIIRFLGTDGELSFKELRALILNSDIGCFGISTRFRPSYFLLRFLETFTWEGDPFLWYLTRIVIFAVSVIILWYLLDIKFGLIIGLIITLSTFSFKFWGDIFSCLGPAETYAVLGLALYSLGFAKYVIRRESGTHLKACDFSDWVLMVSGAFIAIGSKENFVLLIIPAGYLLIREIIRKRFNVALLVNSLLIIGYGFLVIAAIWLGTSKSGTDIYSQSISIASRSTILVQYVKSTIYADILVYSAIGILVSHALIYKFKGKQFFKELVRIISPSLLAVGLALLFILTQVAFYNGKWPTQMRYDFPGILAFLFILLVLIYTFLSIIGLFSLPPRYIRGSKLILTSSFILIIILNGGYEPLIESSKHNYQKTTKFTHHIERIVPECRNNPNVPIVLQSYSVGDYEPVLSVCAILRAKDVTNPLFLKINGYFPDSYGPGLLRRLVINLQRISLKGGYHGYSYLKPISELDEKKEHYVIDFNGSTRTPFKNLGRIWH